MKTSLHACRGCHGSDRMIVGFTTMYMQSVPVTTKVVSLNATHGEVYSIQHCVIPFVSLSVTFDRSVYQ